MAAYSFTREDLRTFQTKSTDWTGAYLGALENNSSTTAYFAIEGARYYVSESGFIGYKYKDIFNSASISSLTNGSFVSGSTNCGIIVNPNSTSGFAFTFTGTVSKDQLLISAPNVKSVSDGGDTVNFYGVTFTATGT
jgi:hypothetical protein